MSWRMIYQFSFVSNVSTCKSNTSVECNMNFYKKSDNHSIRVPVGRSMEASRYCIPSICYSYNILDPSLAEGQCLLLLLRIRSAHLVILGFL